MKRVRSASAVVASVLLAAISSIASGLGPALADPPAPPVVLVSTDGVTFAPALTVALFANAGLLVPGDTASSELFIKNPTTTPATVRVSVGDIRTSSQALGDNMTLKALNTSDGASITASWNQLARCDIVVQPVTVAGGAVIRVDLTLTMLNARALIAQHQNGSLTVNIEMRDAAAGSFPKSACNAESDPGTTPAGTGHGSVLGNTGGVFPTELLIVGGILIAAGWWIVARRRRRAAASEETDG